MKLVNWVRFSWDLTKLPPLDCKLPEHYEIAPASREDETELRKVISRSIVLDATWNPAMQEVMQTINTWLDEAFASPTSIFLALRHGARIIGASILSPIRRENHLGRARAFSSNIEIADSERACSNIHCKPCVKQA